MIKFVRALALGLMLTILAGPVLADAKIEKPSKESVIQVWEDTLKTNEYTKTFAASDTPGVYNFETTLFPYKGALKVLNVVIAPPEYDYDIAEADAPYRGYIEYELVNAPKDFFQKYFQSYRQWQKLNTFFYSAASQKWVTEDEIKRHDILAGLNTSAATVEDTNVKPHPHSFGQKYGELIVTLCITLGALLGFLAIVLFITRDQRKKQVQNYSLMMERQLKSVTLQEESLTALRDILEQLKKSN